MFFLMAKFNSTGDSPSTMSLMLLFGMLMASIDITGLSLSLSLSLSPFAHYTLGSKIKILLEKHYSPQLDIWSSVSGDEPTFFYPLLQSTTLELWQKLCLDLLFEQL